MKNDAAMVKTLKVLIWMNMPSHHQSAFFQALREQGVDLIICYYGKVSEERRALGWRSDSEAEESNSFYVPETTSLEVVPDWRKRIHVVPGYGSRFLRILVKRLSEARVIWFHWSERSRPGLRWYITFPIKRWYACMVNRYAAGGFCIGNLALEDCVKWGINRELLSILPYAPTHSVVVNKARWELLAEKVADRSVFLYTGSLERRKGIDVLLKAFAHVLKRCRSTNWMLALVGPDRSSGRYELLAKRLGIIDQVLFLGATSWSDLATDYAVAKVFVLPTRHDGWGAVVSEAMGHGKAIIVTNQAGAAQHLVDPGVNGFVVKAGDVKSLAYALEEYIVKVGLAERHGAASTLIYQRFSPSTNAARFVAILRNRLSLKMGASSL